MIDYSKSRLLPFSIIKAAASGDAEAMSAVLKHYERYIGKLSLRQLYGENAHPHLSVDEELRLRLETKLIHKVLTFKVD